MSASPADEKLCISFDEFEAENLIDRNGWGHPPGTASITVEEAFADLLATIPDCEVPLPPPPARASTCRP